MRIINLILISLFVMQCSAIEISDTIKYENTLIITDLSNTDFRGKRHLKPSYSSHLHRSSNGLYVKESYSYFMADKPWISLIIQCGANRIYHNWGKYGDMKNDTINYRKNNLSVMSILSNNDSLYFRTDYYPNLGGILITGMAEYSGKDKLDSLMDGIVIKRSTEY